jgi:hypothetical protein
MQSRTFGDRTIDGFGIMRSDDPTGQRDVGEILAVGVELGVRRV